MVVWVYFAASEAGQLVIIDRIINSIGNDSKYTGHYDRAWLEKIKINDLAWSSQTPDLNPIEMLCKQYI